MQLKPHLSHSSPKKLSISLLGTPVIEHRGEPVEVDTRKAIAILAYVALEKGIHSRDTLAALLWPESDESRARAALRRTLSHHCVKR